MTPEQATDQIYWQYSQAKNRWRRHTQKPVRRVRRFVRRKGGKGKGGRRASAFIAEDPDLQAFFKGKSGKGKGRKGKGPMSTGKGLGRKRNPTGGDGTVMKCHECGSEEHLVRQCPRRRSSGPGLGLFVDSAAWYNAHGSTPIVTEAGPDEPARVFFMNNLSGASGSPKIGSNQ